MPGGYLRGWDAVNEVWVKITCDADGKIIIDPTAILENPPTEDEDKKAPTSEWAFDHAVNAAAHHAKYTDAEAKAACGLDGTLYWSCAGIAFDAAYPDINDVRKYIDGVFYVNGDGIFLTTSVNLPNGAIVTGAVVLGNAAATDEGWALRRIKLSDASVNTLATADINTEDTSISYAIIDNSLYAYLFYTSSLDTGDQIYGARISYTI
jgi:hypothetical protein